MTSDKENLDGVIRITAKWASILVTLFLSFLAVVAHAIGVHWQVAANTSELQSREGPVAKVALLEQRLKDFETRLNDFKARQDASDRDRAQIRGEQIRRTPKVYKD